MPTIAREKAKDAPAVMQRTEEYGTGFGRLHSLPLVIEVIVRSFPGCAASSLHANKFSLFIDQWL